MTMTLTLPGPHRPTARCRSTSGEIFVDCFAGAGGASLGIEKALGRAVDAAVNHSALMVRLHELNHPDTRHYVTDIWHVDPLEVAGGRPVGGAWFSPDCTHFSRARGGRPVKKRIRCLAWTVARWAKAVRPRVIWLENVPEFQTWGPVDKAGFPVKRRAGETFRRWIAALEKLGYAVEWRVLCAADYGVPTIRKRFFCIARCDGRPIVWPARTHAPRAKAAALGLKPWRSAAECIDWSLPCPSIFLTRTEARTLGVKRPLAEATMRRIARGIKKFVLDSADPFIVRTVHGDSGRYGDGTHSFCEPLSTLTASKDFALAAPVLTGYHASKGGETRASAADDVLPTQDASNRFGLVEAFLAKHYGGRSPAGIDPREPAGTVTAIDHHAVVVAPMTAKFYGICRHGSDEREPLPTVTGGGQHIAHVEAFLMRYFGQGIGQDPREPAATATSKDHCGEDYRIVDIGLRMLRPQELLRAQFGPEYAAEYILIGTQAEQVSAIGNSVPPQLAEALVRANMNEGTV
jgi:DNA (cytosine-5)-methyltransferase 1